MSEHVHELEPGQTCPTCNRRVNHPRKPSTPKSRPKAYRIPEDEREAHEDTLTTTARFLGVYEQPFWEFKTYALALALVLQDDSLEGFGRRAA